MANNVRFVDSIKVGAYGTGGGSSISSSYAETSSFSHYATSASYAVSASHEIIKEVSSSHADTASFAQSGDGIFSGSFSGSYVGDGSSLTGIITDPFPYTGSAIITGSFEVQSGTSTMYFESGSSIGSDDGKILIKSTGGPSNISLWRTDGKQATYHAGGGGIGLYYDNSGYFGIQPTATPAELTSFPTATSFYMNSAGHVGINTNDPKSRFYVVGKIATTTDVSASGDMYGVTGSFSHLLGDGSQLTGIVSSSYALTASYAISASHEIIKEVSSSHADTASFAQSGDGIFSGSFSGSFQGDGSQLTGIDSGSWDGQYSGSAGITGSLTIEGSGSVIFDVQGSAGQLFSVSDGLLGTLMEVNDISGMPLFQVSSSGLIEIPVGPLSCSSDIEVRNITASGDISASGDIYADNITTTGNISASGGGTIYGNGYISNGNSVAEYNIGAGVLQLGNNNGTPIEIGKGTSDPLTINGHITASGNISGSSTSTASFGTYLGDGSQLTGINSSTNLTQSIFVTQNGDDSTATIGDLHKPFATLASASQAATTGSVIFVYPGLYVAPAENLAKPGVDWYFTPGTTVSKSTAGDVFDISGFTDTGMNVYGYADFILGSSAGSLLNSLNAGPNFDYTFQCRDIFSDSSTAIVDYYAPDDHSINWEFRNMSASAGSGFSQANVNSDGLVNITCDEIIAKEYCVGTGNGFKAGQIRAKKLTSTNSFAVHWYAGSHLTLIVDDAIGVGGDVSTLAYRFTSAGDIDIVGETTGIQMGLDGGGNAYSGICNHVGKCKNLAVEGMTGVYNGTHVSFIDMDGTGNVNINWIPALGNVPTAGYIKQSDGRINARILNDQYYSQEITVTGGTLVADGQFKSTFPYRDITVSAGTFIWKGIYNAYVGSTNYGSQRHIIDQTGGTVKLEGTINMDGANFTSALPAQIVKYNGGKLILNGATLTTVDNAQPTPAIYPDANRDVYIFSGGVNYNQTGSNALLNASGSGYALTNVLGGMIIEDSSIE